MATAPASDRKRVKVYELKNSDWFDRGTGFCKGVINSGNDEAKIVVISEDEPTRQLLETRISKEDGYQKQQETLIVWTEHNGTDMALSFQEPEGCASIWDFVNEMQSRLQAHGQEDGLSDDIGDHVAAVVLPDPELGNLHEIENSMRATAATPGGRDSLAKFVLNREYIPKLIPLVEMAEDLESLEDLHRLCSIMKMLILLNDTTIIEYCVTDDVYLGVVGALEYDPDFPHHKANHRQFLSDESRFKEVVKIEDLTIKRKIHYTYRLQYLKDVVLARILDDPTFSVLNTLMFYHQVDIAQLLQSNPVYLKELFGIFNPLNETSMQRKKDAALIIQQFCTIAKSLQGSNRQMLYTNFINHGLLDVIQFALKNPEASVRVAGSDILVALIEHDSVLVRHIIFKATLEKGKPLTDTLIELLLVEVDLGVKAQMADAIKHLLDPSAIQSSVEALSRGNGEFLNKLRSSYPASHPDTFIQTYYEQSARKLFQPLQDLEDRESLDDLTIPEVDLFLHLLEILSHFSRQHHYRSKQFILSEGLLVRVALLLKSPQKHLKLAAIRFFRTSLGMHDEFSNRQMIQHNLFEPILQVLYDTMPRNNLLNSACLELFELIWRENIKDLVTHLVSVHREKLQTITYVETFRRLILRYDQMQEPVTTQELDNSFTSVDSEAPASHVDMVLNGGKWGQGLKELDADEEAYFNGSDDDEDMLSNGGKVNGALPVKPLVNYPDDDEGGDDEMDILATSTPTASPLKSSPVAQTPVTPNTPTTRSSTRANNKTPPERISEKRRREEEEEDELLANIPSSGTKRKAALQTSSSTESLQKLRRKNSMTSAKDTGATKKMTISIPLKSSVVEPGKED